MAAKFRAEASGDHVKVFCTFDEGKPSTLCYLHPEEARRLAKYLELSAAQVERAVDRSRR